MADSGVAVCPEAGTSVATVAQARVALCLGVLPGHPLCPRS